MDDHSVCVCVCAFFHAFFSHVDINLNLLIERMKKTRAKMVAIVWHCANNQLKRRIIINKDIYRILERGVQQNTEH